MNSDEDSDSSDEPFSYHAIFELRAELRSQFVFSAMFGNGGNRRQRTYRAYVSLLAADINADWADLNAAIEMMLAENRVRHVATSEVNSNLGRKLTFGARSSNSAALSRPSPPPSLFPTAAGLASCAVC